MKLYICGEGRGDLYEFIGPVKLGKVNQTKTVVIGNRSCDMYEVEKSREYVYIEETDGVLYVESVKCVESEIPDPWHLNIRCSNGRVKIGQLIVAKILKQAILRELGVIREV